MTNSVLYCFIAIIKALFYILHIITVDTARSRAMPFLLQVNTARYTPLPCRAYTYIVTMSILSLLHINFYFSFFTRFHGAALILKKSILMRIPCDISLIAQSILTLVILERECQLSYCSEKIDFKALCSQWNFGLFSCVKGRPRMVIKTLSL